MAILAFPGAGALELRFFLRGGWRVSIFFSSARFALQSDYLVSPCARADGRLRSCKLLACVVYVAVATLKDSDVGWMASGGVRRRFSPRSSQSSRYFEQVAPPPTALSRAYLMQYQREGQIASGPARLAGQSSGAASHKHKRWGGKLGSAEQACRQTAMTPDRCESPPMPQDA